MDMSPERIGGLVANPSESLNVEIKRWIDPTAPEGIAKIARAAIALRNRNGGYLVIGFDDGTLQPDPNRPADVRATFHVDVVQGIVSGTRMTNSRSRLGSLSATDWSTPSWACRRVFGRQWPQSVTSTTPAARR